MTIYAGRIRLPHGYGNLPSGWADVEVDVNDTPSPTPYTPQPEPPVPVPYWKQRGYIGGQIIERVYVHFLDSSDHQCVPGPRGSGPTDIDYYIDVVIEKGGWINDGPGKDNIGYFIDVIEIDLRSHGYRRKSSV